MRIVVTALCGSIRDESQSRTALKISIGAAEEAGALVRMPNLEDLPHEQFDPRPTRIDNPQARFLIDAVSESDALLLCSPAYHGSVSGYFKNLMDYMDLLRDASPPFLTGKVVGLAAVGTGTMAVATTIQSMVTIAQALRAHVVPFSVAISNATEDLCQMKSQSRLRLLGAETVRLTKQLKLGALGASGYSEQHFSEHQGSNL